MDKDPKWITRTEDWIRFHPGRALALGGVFWYLVTVALKCWCPSMALVPGLTLGATAVIVWTWEHWVKK